MLKKCMLMILCLVVFLGQTPVAFANGIPVFQYEQTLTDTGSYTIRADNESTWDWKEPNGSPWGGKWSYNYYKVLRETPAVSAPYGYAANLQMRTRVRDYGRFLVQGYDGHQWVTLVTCGPSGSDHVINLNFNGSYSKFRLLAVLVPNAAYGGDSHTNSYVRDIRFEVHAMSADQATVETARDAADAAAANAVTAVARATEARDRAAEARNAADAAAARVWDAAEGKSAAALAKEARDRANDALTKIQNVEFTVNSLQTSIGPQVLRVSGLNCATATTSSSYTVDISAMGAPGTLRYRVVCGDFDSGWRQSNVIDITGLSGTGARTARIYVSNNPDNPEHGAITETTLTFFKL